MKAPQFPASSAIVYDGPSRINGERIVGIVTGIHGDSDNPKTGVMAQLYILDARMHPMEAIKTGADYAICGDCKLRGDATTRRACYVTMNAPGSIYRAFVRGSYQRMDPHTVGAYLASQRLPIRFGAYGDPSALPLFVLRDLMQGKVTGYTHQWNDATFADYRQTVMASVDTVAEAQTAQAAGWRTFRTRFADDPLMPGEIACPASAEMGYRTVCADCTLCDGSRGSDDRRKNIAIIVHGSNAGNYAKLVRRDGTAVL